MAPSRIPTVRRLIGSQLPRSMVICTLQEPSKDVSAWALPIVDWFASVATAKKHDNDTNLFISEVFSRLQLCRICICSLRHLGRQHVPLYRCGLLDRHRERDWLPMRPIAKRYLIFVTQYP